MRVFLFFLCSIFYTPTILATDSLSIEPPHWWVGMKNQSLQLMLHGLEISEKKITISKPGVKLNKISKGDSPNYIFLDLIIQPFTKPGNIDITIGDQKIKYKLEARVSNAAAKKGFDTGDIIYLVNPDRFANGDSTNDNATSMSEKINRTNKDGRHGGDIQGIIDHLDYIHDMGFTAIWSTPLLENNLSSFTYHGYAISDFYRIDPRFGSNELYKALSVQAKNKSIKLIKDIVLNHCGSGHHWMKDMPCKDWINFDGKYVNTNHRRETNQDPHASAYDKELMQAGWFVPTMPDLNTRNPFLAKYLIQNSIWWIEYADLAGLRIDTYPYVDKTFSAEWSKSVMQEYPLLNIVGEEWSTNPLITSYWQRNKKNTDGYNSYLPAIMDFSLQESIVKALNENEGFNSGLIRIYHTLANDFVYADLNNIMYFLDNHDMSRFYTQIRENFDHWKLGMVLLCTMRGIPQIYYGTEILMTNPRSDDHGEIRADMPGGWIQDTKNVFTDKNLSSKESEAKSFLKKLCHLRIARPALHKGKLIHFAPQNGIYVYFKILGQERYMILLNKNNNEVKMDFTKYKELLLSNNQFENIFDNTKENIELAQQIKGKGFKILKW